MSEPNIPLNIMAREVRDVNTANGWRGGDVAPISFGELVALLHSEVSEALEAYRDRGFESWYRDDGKPEGVGSELADVLIRLLDTADRVGVDLASAYVEKLAHNRGRSWRHGGKRL